jgi:hypothetical protein
MPSGDHEKHRERRDGIAVHRWDRGRSRLFLDGERSHAA